MKILVVDDGQLAINSLIRILCRVAPDCDYISAMTTDDALTWMRQGPMDAAFLNLEMPGMNGLALARMIQKLQPRCNIIVVTEHPEYALEALQIFVSGFLLKPANEADVRNVLENLRYPPETAPVGIKIQCFGNFEIFVGGRPLSFKRNKSKELLAYLVDRNGATCTNGEMLAVLWEDKPDTASLHSHLRNLTSAIRWRMQGSTGCWYAAAAPWRWIPARWTAIIITSCGETARPSTPTGASI